MSEKIDLPNNLEYVDYETLIVKKGHTLLNRFTINEVLSEKKHIYSVQDNSLGLVNMVLRIYKIKNDKQIQQKAEKLVEIRHPNICRHQFYIIHEKNHLLMFQEYCNGGTLEEYLKRNKNNKSRKMDLELVKSFFRQILQGLQQFSRSNQKILDYLEKGNLRADTIVISLESAQTTLLKINQDWGMGDDSGVSPEKKQFYTAPEILKQKVSQDHKGITYSLGVILYYIIFRALPSLESQSFQIKNQIDDEIDEMFQLENMLQNDPKNRHTLEQLFKLYEIECRNPTETKQQIKQIAKVNPDEVGGESIPVSSGSIKSQKFYILLKCSRGYDMAIFKEKILEGQHQFEEQNNSKKYIYTYEDFQLNNNNQNKQKNLVIHILSRDCEKWHQEIKDISNEGRQVVLVIENNPQDKKYLELKELLKPKQNVSCLPLSFSVLNHQEVQNLRSQFHSLVRQDKEQQQQKQSCEGYSFTLKQKYAVKKRQQKSKKCC